jgi:Zn-dependent peptidase ImmA (M78 family)
MLKAILEAAKLDSAFCAELLGVPRDQFSQWLLAARPIPDFIIPELCSILGVREKELAPKRMLRNASESMLAPAIWFKLRDERLTEADRELVAVIRKLGFYLTQLQSIRGRVTRFDPLFRSVRDRVDKTAPPAIQGKVAALAFRSASGLGQREIGIGEALRPFLRALGILVIESPLSKSSVDGCSFQVGYEGSLTPTLFANTYGSTWFRRNVILMHELGHAIFDLDNEQVAVDYKDEDASGLSESRAQAFAQECLVPKSVLVQFASRFGLKWESLTEKDLAILISNCHVEQRLVLRAALEAELIDQEHFEKYILFDCAGWTREFSPHALSTQEYIDTLSSDASRWWLAENRNTTVGTRTVRLPSGYIAQVLDALNANEISSRKAAEMLLMDEESVQERFGELLTVSA